MKEIKAIFVLLNLTCLLFCFLFVLFSHKGTKVWENNTIQQSKVWTFIGLRRN